MTRRYAAAALETSGISLHFGLYVPLSACHGRTELGARADRELPVDTAEVCLDGLRAHECRLCHLAVRQPASREFGYPQLGRRQFVRGAVTQANAGKLGLRPTNPGGRAESLKDLDSLSKRICCGELVIGPAMKPTFDQKRPSELEWQPGRRDAIELSDRGERPCQISLRRQHQ